MVKKHQILILDDELDNLEALERLFRKKYSVLKSTSGREALELIKDQSVALIISDQRMPEMTGVEFLEQTLISHPDTLRILLTGYTDIKSVVEAINRGHIYQYITKPWDPDEIKITVDRAIEQWTLKQNLKEKNIQLEAALIKLQALNESKNQFMILINHELKTPITNILNFTQLAQNEEISPILRKALDHIHNNAHRLHQMISNT